MSQAPAMPLFWGDYWSKTRRLTPAQHHAYLFLLGTTWMNNCRPLKDDDEAIAGEIGISLKAWLRVRPALIRFFDLSDGTWRNHKLEEVWSNVMRRMEKNRENGRSGGRPRKEPQSENGKQNQHTEKPDGLVSLNPNESIQSQSQISPSGDSARQSARDVAEAMLAIWREELADTLGSPTKIAADRIKKCSARLRDDLGGDLENWRELCRRIRRSEFLTEKWKATIDWVLEPKNMRKVLEGNYDRERSTPIGKIAESDDDAKWRQRLSGHRKYGNWVGLWGPRPDDPRCYAPAALLSEFGYGHKAAAE